MREIRTSGSEGGGTGSSTSSSYPYRVILGISRGRDGWVRTRIHAPAGCEGRTTQRRRSMQPSGARTGSSGCPEHEVRDNPVGDEVCRRRDANQPRVSCPSARRRPVVCRTSAAQRFGAAVVSGLLNDISIHGNLSFESNSPLISRVRPRPRHWLLPGLADLSAIEVRDSIPDALRRGDSGCLRAGIR